MSERIDQAVAQHIMGFETRMQEGCRVYIPGERGFDAGPWSPSTDISAAWRVVEKMDRDGWSFTIYGAGGLVEAYFENEQETAKGHAVDKASLAICIAALHAKGVEVPT